ncbi:MAG TPA: NAD(P)-dependent oxidoreductase [Candidatus Tectomicrobia bacterium]|nr:NAD(P)-dependent oxidoreductase [Candidatus Tectomicrobia bacterium]
MRDRVGFIGLGTMGGPMAANLARAGVPLVVHDASAAAVAAAATLPGVTVADAPAAVAEASRVLFTCLPNDAIVRAVYLGPGGVSAGGGAGLVTCDCSTVSPDTTLEVAAALARGGITHLDTPMLGSQPQAVSGEIFFIVGGDRAQLEVVAPYLEIMGRLHMHVGGSGMANRVKLVHNGLAAVVSVAVAEALAVTVQSGVDPYTFDEVVRNGGGMAHGTYFERRARRILDGDFSPTFTAELMLKDVGLALDLARAAKVPAALLEETRRAYEAAVAGGWGKEDFSAVTHVVEQRIGRRLSQRNAGGARGGAR